MARGEVHERERADPATACERGGLRSPRVARVARALLLVVAEGGVVYEQCRVARHLLDRLARGGVAADDDLDRVPARGRQDKAVRASDVRDGEGEGVEDAVEEPRAFERQGVDREIGRLAGEE
jgi:hypothetical protein